MWFVERGQTESDVSTPVGDVTVDGTVEGDVRSGRGDIEVGGDGVTGDVKAGFRRRRGERRLLAATSMPGSET